MISDIVSKSIILLLVLALWCFVSLPGATIEVCQPNQHWNYDKVVLPDPEEDAVSAKWLFDLRNKRHLISSQSGTMTIHFGLILLCQSVFHVIRFNQNLLMVIPPVVSEDADWLSDCRRVCARLQFRDCTVFCSLPQVPVPRSLDCFNWVDRISTDCDCQLVAINCEKQAYKIWKVLMVRLGYDSNTSYR